MSRKVDVKFRYSASSLDSKFVVVAYWVSFLYEIWLTWKQFPLRLNIVGVLFVAVSGIDEEQIRSRAWERRDASADTVGRQLVRADSHQGSRGGRRVETRNGSMAARRAQDDYIGDRWRATVLHETTTAEEFQARIDEGCYSRRWAVASALRRLNLQKNPKKEAILSFAITSAVVHNFFYQFWQAIRLV